MIEISRITNRKCLNKCLHGWIIISFLIIELQGCNSDDNQKIAGKYQFDKFVLRKDKKKDPREPILILNSNNTFELLRDNKLNGTWRKTNLIGEEKNIEFQFFNKRITGKLNGTIIYFEYPNDFDSGIFESMIYVKKIE